MTEPKLKALLSGLGMKVLRRTPEGWLVASCPFAKVTHRGGVDRNPSFMVHINAGGPSGFNCFSCKAHGNLPALVRQLEDVRGEDLHTLYMQAVLDETPDSFGEFDERAWAEETVAPTPLNPAQFRGMFEDAWEAKASRRYLAGRNISEKTVRTLGLLYDPDERRVLFPVYGKNRDELFGFTGRTTDPDGTPKVKNYAGLKKEWRLLGEHLVRPPKPLLVVEGLFALAHLVEIGARDVCNPVAVMGSVLSRHQRDIITRLDLPTHLCFDDDLAGDIGLFGPILSGRHNGKGAVALLEKQVPTFVVKFPDGVDDVDDFTLADVRQAIFPR